MLRLQLHFHQEKDPQLTEMVLFTSSGLRRRSVRGKTAGIDREAGTFQWTAGVKAHCLLAIRSLEDQSFLRGETGSPAAALDYALSKPPTWVQELFGGDGPGGSFVSRYFLRSNPERKRPGPVSICFHPSHLSKNNIEIFLNGRKLQASEAEALAPFIESDFERTNRRVQPHLQTPAEGPRSIHATGLENCFREVMRERIGARNIFFRSELQHILRRASEIPRLAKNYKAELPRISEFDQGLTGALLRGVCPDEGLRNELRGLTLDVACVASHLAIFAMLKSMSEQYELRIRHDYKFTYGYDLVRDFIDRKVEELPDLIFLGIGPAFDLMRACPDEYRPLMIAPAAVHRIISHRNVASEEIGKGSFHVMTEEATSLACSFDSLCAEGIVQRTRSEVIPFDMGEMSLMFRRPSEGFHSLVWAPYSYFFTEACGGVERKTKSQAELQETVVVAHRRFFENSRRRMAFEVLFRQVWWSYLQRPERLAKAAKGLARDKDYIGTISACLGLSNTEGERNALFEGS